MLNERFKLTDWSDSSVFIVDDDAPACASIAAMISAFGIKCETFDSAEAFLSAGRQDQPGCLITDLQLGGMDGRSLIRHLWSSNCTMPAIIVSGHIDIRTAVEAMANGAVTVLEKPVRPFELWEHIVRALSLDAKKREAKRLAEEYRTRRNTLTESELEVLECLIRGEPHKTIAINLDLAPRTVDLRRKAILQKMGVETIVELAAMISGCSEE